MRYALRQCDDRLVPRRVSSPELIGREQELAALLDALERADGGRFSAVFLAGESGVGKSRLLEEFAHEAESRDAHVLVGECVALADGELPYGPIRAALRPLGAELDALPDEARAELARLLPQLGDPGPPAPGRSPSGERLAQSRLFELLLGVLLGVAEKAPVVLAIEDIHWADRSTLDLLAFLIANARHERLALVCSYRTDELHRRHPLRPFLAQHERRPAVERVDLEPFTPDELEAQVGAILRRAPDAELVRRLYERTEGNPFFVEELLAGLGDDHKLPVSLRDALMLRIEELSEHAQYVLRLAATHGRLVTHRLLAAACDLPEDELHDALRDAVVHHVLIRRDRDTFAFRHALVVEALVSDLLPGERAGFHLALAQALANDPTLIARDGRAAAELCAHWLGAHRLPEALTAAVRAGAEAEDVYAFAEASHHFMRALELWDQVDGAAERAGMDEPALLARAAEAAALGDDGAAATRLIGAAIQRVDARVDPYRAALLRERLGHYMWMFSGDDDGAMSAYREAVALLPADKPRPELARALATLGQLLTLRGQTDDALDHSERALTIARVTGARAAEALALDALGGALCLQGDRLAGIAHLRESLRINEELGEIDGTFRAYVNLGEMLDQDGRLEESVQVVLDGAARLAELGMRDGRMLLIGEAATRLVKLGRLDEADQLTEAAPDLQPSLAKLAQCAARARIAVHRGRLEEAQMLVRAAEGALPEAPATWTEPLGSARVELELLRGRPEDARRLAEDALDPPAERAHVPFTARLHALCARAGAELAERARAGGAAAAADESAARARDVAERLTALLDPEAWRTDPPPEALVHRDAAAAECARAEGTAGASAWAAIAERWAALGLPLEQAYARLREAECLALEGERARAAEALVAGLELTTGCGASWLQGQLDALARRARLPLPADAHGARVDDAVERLGLTEREQAVLELLAQGLSNREIGEQLFMATKTASVHVSRILAKLDVSSRVEAATAAQRLGLVP
jgi:ATP/maltotriose-dependent transcriptional regulator MalT